MSHRVFGLVTVGLVLGVAQFASTGVITVWYLRFARCRIDPQVDAIRSRVQADPTGGADPAGPAGGADPAGGAGPAGPAGGADPAGGAGPAGEVGRARVGGAV